MIKKLTPKHRAIMRRLIVGEDPKEIAIALNITSATVNRLQRDDPMFMAELRAMELVIQDRLANSEERLSVLQRLEKIAEDAVDFCGGVVRGKEQEVPIELRVKSAWDILDRTGHKAPEKKVIGVVNAADVIVAAYNAKYKKEDEKDAVDI